MPGVGLGWGMLIAWTRGRGDGPYTGRTDVTVVSTLAIVVTRRFRIRLGFRLGVALLLQRKYRPLVTVGEGRCGSRGGFA